MKTRIIAGIENNRHCEGATKWRPKQSPSIKAAVIITLFAFLLTQCGIGMAAPIYKEGQNLRSKALEGNDDARAVGMKEALMSGNATGAAAVGKQINILLRSKLPGRRIAAARTLLEMAKAGEKIPIDSITIALGDSNRRVHDYVLEAFEILLKKEPVPGFDIPVTSEQAQTLPAAHTFTPEQMNVFDLRIKGINDLLETFPERLNLYDLNTLSDFKSRGIIGSLRDREEWLWLADITYKGLLARIIETNGVPEEVKQGARRLLNEAIATGDAAGTPANAAAIGKSVLVVDELLGRGMDTQKYIADAKNFGFKTVDLLTAALTQEEASEEGKNYDLIILRDASGQFILLGQNLNLILPATSLEDGRLKTEVDTWL